MRKPHVTVYVNPDSPDSFRRIGDEKIDGSPIVDVVCIFAGNYASATRPYLRAYNNQPPTQDQFNKNIQDVLDSGAVQDLRNQGIKVLLTVLNAHQPVGWSEFTSESAAEDFAGYLKEVVDEYGLDGIDIDDEYSSGVPNDTSLIMVTTKLREVMSDKILSKALFADRPYFEASWNGRRLADNLTFGWQMSYGTAPQLVLPPYTKVGFTQEQLSMGFWIGQPSANPERDAQWLQTNGYGGMMLFAMENQATVELMRKLVNAWYASAQRSSA